MIREVERCLIIPNTAAASGGKRSTVPEELPTVDTRECLAEALGAAQSAYTKLDEEAEAFYPAELPALVAVAVSAIQTALQVAT